ncbi:lysyl oxidase family protein [Aeromicrobium fastidiosum]|uniref:lysyl oxidase family protein n=1 Tax=Aeromicrobium fastidiosum TaxID=52699 RepID=UPI002023592E|nr:lysyl oxidase family protein [Aeromicrobium fastidiosum]MCL8250422.1 lysyl oxidase family protein [Aeromicrobium fastidiosum]
MTASSSRTWPRRAAAIVTLSVVVTLGAPAVAPAATGAETNASSARQLEAQRASADTTLNSVGARYVGARIPIKGYTSGLGSGRHKLVLQRRKPGTRRWVTRAVKHVRNGAYRFSSQTWRTAGRVKFRTVLYSRGRKADVSNVITVRVLATPQVTCANAPSPSTCPRPASIVEQRVVEIPSCPQLTVTRRDETRVVSWAWDAGRLEWVQSPQAWVQVGAETSRAAGAADCIKVVDQAPAGAALPDLRIKDLTKCGLGDSAATGGTCFMIVPEAPFNASFPALAGRKLLKFGVITMNVGDGPGEIVADRSSPDAASWRAFQSFYDPSGALLGSVAKPEVQFYFAGDGHDHWHVRDFDTYELLDATGAVAARAEKHGYCMQDNTSYEPFRAQPRVPTAPVYTDATSCGKGLPDALTIIHGLSRGWGDTYPTTLPDQAVDVTGLADGEYTVRVHADAVGAVTESDEGNNTTEVRISIAGNAVTVVPGTSSGGLS